MSSNIQPSSSVSANAATATAAASVGGGSEENTPNTNSSNNNKKNGEGKTNNNQKQKKILPEENSSSSKEPVVAAGLPSTNNQPTTTTAAATTNSSNLPTSSSSSAATRLLEEENNSTTNTKTTTTPFSLDDDDDDVDVPLMTSFPSKPAVSAAGSLVGYRSQSGTMTTLVTVTGSFEEEPTPTPSGEQLAAATTAGQPRERAHTAPSTPSVTAAEVSSSSLTTTTRQEEEERGGGGKMDDGNNNNNNNNNNETNNNTKTTTAAAAAAAVTTVVAPPPPPASSAAAAPKTVPLLLPGQQQKDKQQKDEKPPPTEVHDDDDDDDDDEELKLAMAMALAIESNPNLTPHEIHELMGTSSTLQQQLPPAPASKKPASTSTTTTPLANRISNMFGGVTANTTKSSSSSTTTKTTTTTTTGSSSGSTTTTTATAKATTTAAAAATTTTSRNNSGNNNNNNHATDAPTTTTTAATTTTTAAKTTTTTTTAAAAAAPTKDAAAELSSWKNVDDNNEAKKDQQPPQKTLDGDDGRGVGNKEEDFSSVFHSAATVPTANITAATSSKVAVAMEKEAAMPPPPPPAASSTQTTQLVWDGVDDLAKEDETKATSTLPPIVKQLSNRSLFPIRQRRNSPKSSDGSSSTATAAAAQNTASATVVVANNSMRSSGSSSAAAATTEQEQPTLSGIAWKRRGGMGKYSTTNAWERRKLALKGNKLVYYRLADINNATPSADEDDLTEVGGGTTAIPESSAASVVSTTSETTAAATTTTKQRWFDNVSWTTMGTGGGADKAAAAALGEEFGTNNGSSLPRGFLDLAKEKATVHAAFGHSGAPTPFAISIKVRGGETKWKLCFDRHATQMEWLNRLSEVVIQNSVDAYNTSLLEAADPAVGHNDYAVYLPPLTKDGAATRDNVTTQPQQQQQHTHRLWMLEPYQVVSRSGSMTLEAVDKGMEVSAAAGGGIDMVESEQQSVTAAAASPPMLLELDHSAAQKQAEEEANMTWMVPEQNLSYMFVLLNVAMAMARASSLSVDGFWYALVLANVGLYWCLVRQLSWRSVLDFVRAVPPLEEDELTNTVGGVIVKPGAKAMASSTALNGSSAAMVKAGVGVKTKPSYIPEAGCTSVKLDEPEDPPSNDKGEMFAGWRTVPGEILKVRSVGYATTKAKVPSPGELYECIALDVFESPQRYPDMGPRVKLPKCEFTDDDSNKPKTWRCPDIFIISLALPTDPPKMGRSSSDGGGYTVTIYFRMKQETRDILRRVTADGYDPSTEKVDDPQKSQVNAVRLLEEWIRRAPTDPKYFSRFKIVPNAHNLKEIGMPNWIGRYNGKPFLIKRPGVTGFIHSHPELSCVEFDVSLHPFPYLAKQGICFMKESYFKRVLVTFGFVIEGKTDDELPECLIGLMQLCYPDPQYAIQAEDFFNGTAPRSF